MAVTFLTNEDEQRIVNAATAESVLFSPQILTEKQKFYARENIGAVSVDIVVQKDEEASVSSLKINHSPETSDAIFLEGSVVDDKDSMVVNALTLRGDFGGGIDDGSVIIRNIHAGESPSDAVNLGQLEELFRAFKEEVINNVVSTLRDGSFQAEG